MDFFHEQQKARSQTGKLLGLLGLAMICIIMGIYLLIRLFFGGSNDSSQYEGSQPFFDLGIFIPVSIAVSLVLFVGSIYKVLQLRGGGKQVAQSLGGKRIQPNTRDRDEKKVLNVVEEMAIASGIPPPPVYLLPEPESINAFAAGFNPENAVIGITEGAIRALTRDQLQGVMAHEFSHILNGDMRLNIRLIGLLHGILLISIVGEIMMRSGSHSRKKEGGGIIALGVGLLIIGQIGVFFGHLIKQAVSRQREYLADASAVQFTRDPLGLAGALKKIGGLHKKGSLIKNPEAETASHMFFSNGLRRQAQFLGATHPPLKERVKRIDPAFDGQWPAIDPVKLFKLEPPQTAQPSDPQTPSMPDLFPGAPIPEQVKPILTGVLMAADADVKTTVDQTGNPQRRHLDAAQKLLSGIPESLHHATHDPSSARLLIFALLLNRVEEDDSKATLIKEIIRDQELELFKTLSEEVGTLPAGVVLPLVELSLTGLRELPLKALEVFLSDVQRITEHDQAIDLFEYALTKILSRSLESVQTKPKRTPIRIYSLRGIEKEFTSLLSTMAHLGSRNAEEAATAFQAGMAEVKETDINPGTPLGSQTTLPDVDKLLEKMEQTAFPVRKQVLKASLACLMSDEEIRIEEAELYRALAASMGCPPPLWVATEAP